MSESIVSKLADYIQTNGITKKGFELELRKPIDYTTFKSILDSQFAPGSKYVFKQSFIRSDNNDLRNESFYNNGAREKIEKITKTKLLRININEVIPSTNIVLSKESESDKNVVDVNNARIKFRFSKLNKNLRIDLTITINLPSRDVNAIPKLVDMFLKTPRFTANTTTSEMLEYIFQTDYYKSNADVISYSIELELVELDIKKLEKDFNDLIALTKSLVGVQDPVSQDKIKMISGLIYNNKKYITTIKQLLKNPITLTKVKLSEINRNITDYFVSEKNDGIRAVVLISKKVMSVITDITYKEYQLSDMAEDVTYAFDGELIDNSYVIYDLLYFGKSLIDITYEQRYKIITELELPKHSEIIITYKKLSEFTNNPSENKKLITDLLKKENVDGIVLVKKDETYLNSKIYKFKKNNTIDFLITKVPDNYKNQHGYNKTTAEHMYMLNVTVNFDDLKLLGLDKIIPKDYTHYKSAINNITNAPFSPSINKYAYVYYDKSDDLHEKICEFTLVDGQLKLYNIRADRQVLFKNKTYFGNYFKIAEDNYMQFFNPILPEDFGADVSGYFKADKQKSEAIDFNNYVKDKVMYRLKDLDFVVDLGSGKGQDLFRYASLNIKHLLCVDSDINALSVLVNRKYNLNEIKYYGKNTKVIIGKSTTYPFIEIKCMDLTQPFGKSLKQFSISVQADAVVINLAIHYMVNNTEASISNLFNLVDKILGKKGKFIFSTFNRDKVKTILNTDLGDKLNILPTDDVDKIKVKHHFSGDEYYEEYLVDYKKILNYFVKNGYIQSTDDFTNFLREYPHGKLTDLETKYVSLYSYFTLIKK